MADRDRIPRIEDHCGEDGNVPPEAFGGPIELGPDDKQIYPDPADSIVAIRDDIPHGRLEIIEFESKTVGTSRKLNVYTPPGYSSAKNVNALKNGGINAHDYVSPKTGHESQSWRRSLRELAPLLFQE